jgi:hypothetical protein
VSKLTIPLPEFPITRRLEETNHRFWARVEVAEVNVVGWYAYGEHRFCVEMVPNGGQVNRVFEQASVPYGPRLEPGSGRAKRLRRKGKVTQVSDVPGNAPRCLSGRQCQQRHL